MHGEVRNIHQGLLGVQNKESCSRTSHTDLMTIVASLPHPPTSPLSCPAGKSTTGDDATDHDSVDDCTECGAGKYSGEGEACSDCSAGQYSDVGAQTCSNCDAGKSTTGDEATDHDHVDDCSNCDAGKYSGAGEACSNCSADLYSEAGSATCSDCPAGKHINSGASGDESSVCTICGVGKYSSSASSACTICPAGKYNPDHATSGNLHESCTPCGPGTKLVDDGEHVVRSEEHTS